MKRAYIIIVILILVVGGFYTFSKLNIGNNFASLFNKNKTTPAEIVADTSIEDFKVANIELNYKHSKSDVARLFGKFKSRRVENGGAGPEVWVYDGIEIEFLLLNDFLTGIVITSAKYPTFRGLKVGDNFSEIIKKYPTASKVVQASTDYPKMYLLESLLMVKDQNGREEPVNYAMFIKYDHNLITEIRLTSELMN